MARPKKNIDENQVLKLALINCTMSEMAAVLDCDESTLKRRFAATIKKGQEQGKMSLKRKQYECAMNGNTSMLIWLGKQLLGQTDKVDNTHALKDPFEKMTDEQLYLENQKIMNILKKTREVKKLAADCSADIDQTNSSKA